MKMDQQTYKYNYGKIKILDNIEQRHPVINTCQRDPNRKLMIKFKYGNLTSLQEIKFHDNIKKLIYKVMHSNNVMMDWDDVYQEIWKKIIKSKHIWNQNKGTMVSTWITIVANSVINTLRQNVNKYNSRYCLYDDLCSSNEQENQNTDKEKGDMVSYLNENNSLYDKSFDQVIWDEKYNDFMSSLNQSEKMFMKAVYEMDTEYYRDFHKIKVSHTYLKQKLGYDDTTYYIVMNNVKQKYCKAFDIKFKEDKKVDDNKDDNYLIF